MKSLGLVVDNLFEIWNWRIPRHPLVYVTKVVFDGALINLDQSKR